MVQRYCTNCGAELREDDRFCGNCGRTAHETARVSTPEADVPVTSPPTPEEAAPAVEIQQDRSEKPIEWWQTPVGKIIGVVVAIVTVLVILASLDGGSAIILLAIAGLVAFALYNRRGTKYRARVSVVGAWC